MQTIEQIADALAKQGYHMHLRRRMTDWLCELYTAKLKAVPNGTGATILEAISQAEQHRKVMEMTPGYQIKQ